MSCRYEAVLFDLDGTITDSQEGIIKCVQFALQSLGIEEKDVSRLKSFIGPPLWDTFQLLYHLSDQKTDEAVDKYRQRFRVTGIYENRLYDGIQPLLEHLKKQGVKLAIASTKPLVFVEEVLRYFGIAPLFDAVCGTALDKADSDKSPLIRDALFKLNVPADRAVMIGDRRYDMEGARSVGVPSIGVLYGYGSKDELLSAGAGQLAQSVTELKELLCPCASR
ncbi:HAD hydrolase-like protein [[Clostridium] leptum]|nr:HAD hydrolase-like protein [[Clostridium] leptum]